MHWPRGLLTVTHGSTRWRFIIVPFCKLVNAFIDTASSRRRETTVLLARGDRLKLHVDRPSSRIHAATQHREPLDKRPLEIAAKEILVHGNSETHALTRSHSQILPNATPAETPQTSRSLAERGRGNA
jgi:hypothetical protein